MASILILGALGYSQDTFSQVQGCVPPPAGMVSWWPLDEAPGTGTSADIIGGLDGTWSGDPTAFAGKVNNALAFDGSDSVIVPQDSTLEPAHDLTVDAWVRADGTPGDFKAIVAKGVQLGNFASYALYTGPTEGLFFYVTVNNVFTLSPGVDKLDIWDDEWHHIAGTYDNAKVRLYVDGVEVGGGSAKTGDIQYNLPDSNELAIGTHPTETFFFAGDIDEVEIFNVALSQTEIQAIFNAGSDGKCKIVPEPSEPKTIGFWKNHPDETEEHLSILIGDFLVEDKDDANLVFKVNAKNAHDMLAAQLLAAEINVWNNVPSCSEVDDAITEAQDILSTEDYTGPGTTDAPKKGDKGDVNAIKDILDDFNNNGCS